MAEEERRAVDGLVEVFASRARGLADGEGDGGVYNAPIGKAGGAAGCRPAGARGSPIPRRWPGCPDRWGNHVIIRSAQRTVAGCDELRPTHRRTVLQPNRRPRLVAR